MHEGREGGLGRIWTVPNALSLGRLGLVGVFSWLVLSAHERVAAAAVLAATGITDFLDGYLARRLDQVTTLGKVLDPTADRVVVGVSVVVITVAGAVPPWLAGVVLGRELVVSATVLLLASLHAPRIDVSWLGKAGTFGLMCCFPLFLVGHGPGTFARVLTDITWVGLVPALGLSFAAAFGYIPAVRRAMGEVRTASLGSGA